MKVVATQTTGHALPPRISEISILNLMLKFLFLGVVKLNITIDDIVLISKLTTNEPKKITHKASCHTLKGFTQSQSGTLVDVDRIVQKIQLYTKQRNPLTLRELIKFI